MSKWWQIVRFSSSKITQLLNRDIGLVLNNLPSKLILFRAIEHRELGEENTHDSHRLPLIMDHGILSAKLFHILTGTMWKHKAQKNLFCSFTTPYLRCKIRVRKIWWNVFMKDYHYLSRNPQKRIICSRILSTKTTVIHFWIPFICEWEGIPR